MERPMFRVVLEAWVGLNVAVLALLVMHRATHLKHRLYWRIASPFLGVRPSRLAHDLVVAHQRHR